jgi:hypothetical protein
MLRAPILTATALSAIPPHIKHRSPFPPIAASPLHRTLLIFPPLLAQLATRMMPTHHAAPGPSSAAASATDLTSRGDTAV